MFHFSLIKNTERVCSPSTFSPYTLVFARSPDAADRSRLEDGVTLGGPGLPGPGERRLGASGGGVSNRMADMCRSFFNMPGPTVPKQ